MEYETDIFSYQEKILSPAEAKFFILLGRLESISTSFINIRRAHCRHGVNAAAMFDFYAKAREFWSAASMDITKSLDVDKVEDLKQLLDLEDRGAESMNCENATAIMDTLNEFAQKTGLRGFSIKTPVGPWGKARHRLGMAKNDASDDD